MKLHGTQKRRSLHWQGMHLADAHSPVAIGNLGGRLECISIVAYRAIGNKIYNIMVVR